MGKNNLTELYKSDMRPGGSPFMMGNKYVIDILPPHHLLPHALADDQLLANLTVSVLGANLDL